ncbi:type IV toxin-antitoxin system AbiEi family antitoxin domain-containing protein [uncultured Mobiluncus sp.]|uniref:type IV toxin-antitoxin system AbiEi family antitoxin domain-containing protein n=1 Tax=uncultured Mobiluncus sp. TaxID=293425 RepID=UPI0027D9AB42|nr:type IV toxin-antitoxin system AbiEi family antitoxin domain-containing protein [uncultured Mobiluncus sp.]
MTYSNHIAALNELSASEGVFTTAQAARLGITRNALSQAVTSGRAERIVHGAYRLAGTRSDFTDELAAIWKLTDPAAFTHERMQIGAWDGITIGGSTAASLQSLGDFYLSPYRIYAPRRINSRLKPASIAIRRVDPDDVSWIKGLPVTRPERTLVDLCLDNEEWSLVEDSFNSADNLDYDRLVNIIADQPERKSVQESLSAIRGLMERRLDKDRPA